jgi:hypothetical protein
VKKIVNSKDTPTTITTGEDFDTLREVTEGLSPGDKIHD